MRKEFEKQHDCSIANSIALLIQGWQQKLAIRLNKNAATLSLRSVKILLACFAGSWMAACVWLLLMAGHGTSHTVTLIRPMHITNIRIPGNGAKERSVKGDPSSNAVQAFVDSVRRTNGKLFDSLLTAMPGLRDTIEMMIPSNSIQKK